jgi:hypothetical protein
MSTEISVLWLRSCSVTQNSMPNTYVWSLHKCEWLTHNQEMIMRSIVAPNDIMFTFIHKCNPRALNVGADPTIVSYNASSGLGRF